MFWNQEFLLSRQRLKQVMHKVFFFFFWKNANDVVFSLGWLHGGSEPASPHCVEGLQSQSRDQLRSIYSQSGWPVRWSQDRDPEGHPPKSQRWPGRCQLRKASSQVRVITLIYFAPPLLPSVRLFLDLLHWSAWTCQKSLTLVAKKNPNPIVLVELWKISVFLGLPLHVSIRHIQTRSSERQQDRLGKKGDFMFEIQFSQLICSYSIWLKCEVTIIKVVLNGVVAVSHYLISQVTPHFI